MKFAHGYKYFISSIYNLQLSIFREEMKAKEKALLEEMLKGQKEQETSDSDETIEFKAKPVPEHVMKPIFSKMVEKHPHR